jgi:hypothetical protein
LFDLYEITPLRASEQMFYEIGLSPEEAISVLDGHLDRLQELARYILAHVHASVLGDKSVLRNADFLARLDLRNQDFDPAQMRTAYAAAATGTEKVHEWNLNPLALE